MFDGRLRGRPVAKIIVRGGLPHSLGEYWYESDVNTTITGYWRRIVASMFCARSRPFVICARVDTNPDSDFEEWDCWQHANCMHVIWYCAIRIIIGWKTLDLTFIICGIIKSVDGRHKDRKIVNNIYDEHMPVQIHYIYLESSIFLPLNPQIL